MLADSSSRLGHPVRSCPRSTKWDRTRRASAPGDANRLDGLMTPLLAAELCVRDLQVGFPGPACMSPWSRHRCQRPLRALAAIGSLPLPPAGVGALCRGLRGQVQELPHTPTSPLRWRFVATRGQSSQRKSPPTPAQAAHRAIDPNGAVVPRRHLVQGALKYLYSGLSKSGRM